MKKQYFFSSLATALLLAVFAVSAFSQTTLKIGIVDYQQIVQQMPETDKADKELAKLQQTYRDSLLAMQQEFITRGQQYEKESSMMTAEQKQAEEDALRALQQQIQIFQEEKFGMAGELAQKREQLLQPIIDKIEGVIAEVAKQEKINIVLDKTSQAVVYSEDKFDITFTVLDKLKRGME